ncbi:hypothetical protein CFE70_009725 [Pyrenophora teres f. teres 0-1]|nr:hypothetical protein HRS9139_08235 [Pyrenophora teres f. teres]KAE8860105.1 hypothetical protein PTNB73_07715 [Pyrenophora teres f. teres]
MSYAPDGRLLSPGEVYEAAPVPVKDDEWQEDLNVALICPDCKENPRTWSRSSAPVTPSVAPVVAFSLRGPSTPVQSGEPFPTTANQGNDDPSRIGDAANPLLHGSQLQTEIGFGDGGMRVRDLSRAHNKSNHDKVNKALQAAYGQITALCDSQNISRPTAETAKMLFKMTDDAKLFKGKSQDAIIAGCIFIACRKHDQQRSFREIFKMTNVSKKEVGRTFKVLEAFIQKSQNNGGPSIAGNGAVIDTVNLLNQKGGTTATSAASLMPRACAKLALGTQVQMVAEECADQVAHYGVAAGRSPLSIAGACLYLVSHLMGQPKSPKEIGLAVEVSDGTIRTAYKLMHTEQDKIIKPEWIAKGGDRSRIPAA